MGVREEQEEEKEHGGQEGNLRRETQRCALHLLLALLLAPQATLLHCELLG